MNQTAACEPVPTDRATTLGIDIGGSTIKAALVDTNTGALVSERHRVPTPNQATPSSLADAIVEVTRQFSWSGTVGVTFPGIVRDGSIWSAANVDDSWVGVDASQLFGQTTGCHMTVINDADAAGLAEVWFGAAREHHGVVLVLTFGTGIGSALFVNGTLTPNTEFGHLQLDEHADIEHWVAARVRDKDGLSLQEWGRRLHRYLEHLESLVSPDLIVIGGAISNDFDQFQDQVYIRSVVRPAHLKNNAGLVGAATNAHKTSRVPRFAE